MCVSQSEECSRVGWPYVPTSYGSTLSLSWTVSKTNLFPRIPLYTCFHYPQSTSFCFTRRPCTHCTTTLNSSQILKSCESHTTCIESFKKVNRFYLFVIILGNIRIYNSCLLYKNNIVEIFFFSFTFFKS